MLDDSEGTDSREPVNEIYKISEIITLIKESNIDEKNLIKLIKEIQQQVHDENMEFFNLQKNKQNIEHKLADKSQDYALLISAIAIVCGSLVAYLASPWAGAVIGTAGLGSTALAKLLKSKKSVESHDGI